MDRPLDTSANALERQRAAIRKLSPGRRLEIAIQLSDEVRALAYEGVRRRQPTLSREDAEAEVGRIVGRAADRSARPSRG